MRTALVALLGYCRRRRRALTVTDRDCVSVGVTAAPIAVIAGRWDQFATPCR
jgi:hypothetical protein